MLAGHFQGTRRFRVVRELGAGGMGVVYEAVDRDSDTRIAIKTLHRLDPDAIGRFKAEFRALQDFSHPHVVSFGELFEQGGDWFFTMELVDGVSVVEHLQRRRADPDHERRLRAIIDQLVDALAAVHATGMVHRDIKPSNVLVTSAGRVVILDFGLATQRGHGATWTGDAVVGTAAYAAPEQTEPGRVGPGVDWFALGVILYELLTGRLPYEGAMFEIIMAKREGRPVIPPRTLVPEVAADLEALCLALLDREPTVRIATADDWRRRGMRTVAPPQVSATPPVEGGGYTPIFVGRDRELGELRAALARTHAGDVEVVRIVGESGIGKSALVRRFTDAAAASDGRVVVLHGRCHEGESVPFKAIDGIIDALARHLHRLPEVEAATLVPPRAELLTRVFPVLRRVAVFAGAPAVEVIDPQALRTGMFAVLRHLIELLAERCPLILVIDGAQWADDDSVQVLAELVRPPDPPPLLLVLVGGLRDDAPALAAVPTAHTIELGALPPDDATALAERLLERQVGDVAVHARAAAIAAEAGGHPLFIDELIRFTGGRDGAPVDLDAAIAARIADLDPTARHLLELAAIAGYPLQRSVVTRAAGMAPADLQRQVVSLRAASLLRSTGARAADTIEPYHGRVRTTVLDRLGTAERKALHQTLASALAAAEDADPEKLADHLEAAGDPPRAAAYAVEAAARAGRALAFGRAARWYRKAIRLLATPEAARDLWPRLADTLAAAGRGAEAAQAYLQAVPGANSAESLELRRRAAQQYLLSGHIVDGLAAVEEVLAHEDMPYPATPAAAGRLVVWLRLQLKIALPRLQLRDTSDVTARDLARIDLCWHFSVSLSMVDPIRGHVFHARGLLLALRAGDPYRLSRALALEAGFLASIARPQRAEHMLDRAAALAARSGEPRARAFVTCARGQAAFLRGDFPAAVDHAQRAEVQLRDECTGVTWELATTRIWLARALMYQGELVALRRWLPQALRECDGRGDLYGGTTLRASVSSFMHLGADDAATASAAADCARRAWTAPGFHVQHYYAAISEAGARLYRGDLDGAEALMTETFAELQRSLLHRVQFIRIVAHDLAGRVMVARATADDRHRLGRALRAARRLDAEGVPWGRGLAAMLRAGVAARRGVTGDVVRELEAAVAGFDGAAMKLHGAAARACLAGHLGGDAGARMRGQAEATLAGQQVANPGAMIRLLAPGLSP